MAFVCRDQLRDDAAVADGFEIFAMVCDVARHKVSPILVEAYCPNQYRPKGNLYMRYTEGDFEGMNERLKDRSDITSKRIPQKDSRYVRVIATITRILEKIFRSITGEISMHVRLENVEAEVILPVWFIPIT